MKMKKKLRLDPEDLRVQGFATGTARAERGTVRGLGGGGVGAACTRVASCPCDTGAWACGPFSEYSCDYTRAGDTCDSFPTEVGASCIC
jgi:hypothetical protein